MKTKFFRNAAAAVVIASASAYAGTTTPCDKISQDVRDAVAKDPSKVLMIVEDSLVINESCACEIVKSAIVASSADEALVKQIVETAVAVAPKMTAVIQECATGAATGTAVAASGKSGAGPDGSAVSVQPPKDGSSEGGSDYNHGGRVDIRGVYLSLPAAGGVVVTNNGSNTSTNTGTRTKTTVIIRERKVIVTPVSPTKPDPKK